MKTLVGLISDILDHACSSSEKDKDGWGEYRIESCCVGTTIRARKVGGTWEVEDWTNKDA